MYSFIPIFLLAFVLSFGLRLWLARRQMASIERHREHVPPAFEGVIPGETHRRAAAYSLARTRLGMVDTVLEGLLLLIWTVGGGLATLDTAWRSLGLAPTMTGVGVLASIVLVGALLDLPLRIHRTFVIEQRFGFNRTTPGLFALDQLRTGLLLLALGGPLAAVVLWLMQVGGSVWWLYAWVVWLGFNLFVIWAWPAFIAPLFNRFRPLTDDSLRARIESLLARCGFASDGVFVIDGSRRSRHGNAYFSGLGRNKRIVFFDTLLEQLDGDEIEAVLAHELGHFRHRHVTQSLIVMALASLAGLGLLAALIQQAWFFSAFGIDPPSAHAALALFILLLPIVTFFLQPLFARLSRRHEFEADAFAARQCPAEDLETALINLYRENASTLTPDPLWSAVYDSHPPALQRIEHLRRQHGAAV